MKIATFLWDTVVVVCRLDNPTVQTVARGVLGRMVRRTRKKVGLAEWELAELASCRILDLRGFENGTNRLTKSTRDRIYSILHI